MGFVYHANYLVWLDMARTELMRDTGVTYREMEQQGVYLAVSDVRMRYRAPARYDDLRADPLLGARAGLAAGHVRLRGGAGRDR